MKAIKIKYNQEYGEAHKETKILSAELDLDPAETVKSVVEKLLGLMEDKSMTEDVIKGNAHIQFTIEVARIVEN